MKVLVRAIISCAVICTLVAVLAGCGGKSEAKNWEHGDIMTYEQYVALNNLSVELTPQIVEILDLAVDNSQGLDPAVYEELMKDAQRVYSLNDSLKDINTFKGSDIDGMIRNFETIEKDMPELKKKVSE